MLLIPCPHCGPRAEHEFSYGGDATAARPGEDAPVEDWIDFVYGRDNPKGSHVEYWLHQYGCRRWFKVSRDTVTHEITGSSEPGEILPGENIT